ncbi:unnamed protein product [Effrenium voratum]|nr:unnamed protein product [Effrenium voratum]
MAESAASGAAGPTPTCQGVGESKPENPTPTPPESMIPFAKGTIPLEQEREMLMAKHPDRLPILVRPHPRSKLPQLEKEKYLVPKALTWGEFKTVIATNLAKVAELTSKETIYLIVNEKTHRTSRTVEEAPDMVFECCLLAFACRSGEPRRTGHCSW